MSERARRRAAVVVAAIVMAGVAACETTTEPPFSSGSMSFDWALAADEAVTSWSVSGTCGSRGFILGSSTCAVGSEESGYTAALGVKVLEGDRYDTATLVHPTGEGSCEASAEPGTRCTLAFLKGRPGSASAPVAEYVLSAGTIVLEIVEVGGVQRLTGTFEGTAVDMSALELDPIEITDGVVDVELVP